MKLAIPVLLTVQSAKQAFAIGEGQQGGVSANSETITRSGALAQTTSWSNVSSITSAPAINGECSANCFAAAIIYKAGTWAKIITPRTYGTVHVSVNTFLNRTSRSTEWITSGYVVDGTTQTAAQSDIDAAVSEALEASKTKTWWNGAVYPTEYFSVIPSLSWQGTVPYSMDHETRCAVNHPSGMPSSEELDMVLPAVPLPTPTYNVQVGKTDPDDPYGKYYGMDVTPYILGQDRTKLVQSYWANWTSLPYLEAIYASCSGIAPPLGPENAARTTALLETTTHYETDGATSAVSSSVQLAPIAQHTPAPATPRETSSPRPSPTGSTTQRATSVETNTGASPAQPMTIGNPDVPDSPDTPDTQESPDTSDAPEPQDSPDAQENPENPENPQTPENTENSQDTGSPENQGSPAAVETQISSPAVPSQDVQGSNAECNDIVCLIMSGIGATSTAIAPTATMQASPNNVDPSDDHQHTAVVPAITTVSDAVTRSDVGDTPEGATHESTGSGQTLHGPATANPVGSATGTMIASLQNTVDANPAANSPGPESGHYRTSTYTINPASPYVVGASHTLTPGGLAATTHGTVYSMVSFGAVVVYKTPEASAIASPSFSSLVGSTNSSIGLGTGAGTSSGVPYQTQLGAGDRCSPSTWLFFAAFSVLCLL